MSERLTDQQYWEQYYQNSDIDRERIKRICGAYDEYWDILFEKVKKGASIVEIGGYPGRFLAYLGWKYEAIPTSLDFNSDRKTIDAVMRLFEVKDYEVIQADFLKHQPDKQYDLVISNGFIEHFENFNDVLDRHVQYLKPGGRMLIMIPNKRGYIRPYRYLVDRANLRAHNLKSMKFSVFRKFAKRNDLDLLKLTYYGGFPYSPHQSLNLAQKVMYKSHKIISDRYLNKYLEKHPNKYLSSSIISIFEKKA